MVPGSCQRRDDYYHEPRYARHPADRQEWSRRRRATDRQAAARRRGAIVIFACDSRATRRGPRGVGGGRRGQLREHNEDAPALRRSFFQAGHAGSIPVTRSHRDVQVTPLPQREPSSFLASGSSACDSRAISSTAGRHRRRCHGGSGSALRDGPRSGEPHPVSCAGRSARLACCRGPCVIRSRREAPDMAANMLPVCRRSWKCSSGAPIAATLSTQRTRLMKFPLCSGPPLSPANTSAPSSSATLLARCSASSSMTGPGATARPCAATTPLRRRRGVEGVRAFTISADTRQTAKPSTTLIWKGPDSPPAAAYSEASRDTPNARPRRCTGEWSPYSPAPHPQPRGAPKSRASTRRLAAPHQGAERKTLNACRRGYELRQ